MKSHLIRHFSNLWLSSLVKCHSTNANSAYREALRVSCSPMVLTVDWVKWLHIGYVCLAISALYWSPCGWPSTLTIIQPVHTMLVHIWYSVYECTTYWTLPFTVNWICLISNGLLISWNLLNSLYCRTEPCTVLHPQSCMCTHNITLQHSVQWLCIPQQTFHTHLFLTICTNWHTFTLPHEYCTEQGIFQPATLTTKSWLTYPKSYS